MIHIYIYIYIYIYIHIYISEDVKTAFDNSNNELNMPLPTEKKQESYWCNEK